MDRLTHENISIRKELAEQSTKAAELRIENGNLQGRITQLSMYYEKEIVLFALGRLFQPHNSSRTEVMR